MEKKRENKIVYLASGAMIAALYVVLTLLANALGLANMAIQIRFSEALCILPVFTPAAIPGLFIGCFLSNLLTGAMPQDVLFGSLATLTGALGTYVLRRYRWLAPIPPILANVIVVPLLLAYVYHIPGGLLYFVLTVGIGEVLSCGVLGMLLLFSLKRHRNFLFK